MAVNAQAFLENLQKTAVSKKKTTTTTKKAAVPDLSIFGLGAKPAAKEKGSAQPSLLFTSSIQAETTALPIKQKEPSVEKAPPKDDSSDAGDAIAALIEKALAAKKALEIQPDIVEQIIHQQSEFTEVFGNSMARQPGEFISIAEMNRTISRTGPMKVAAYIRVSTDSSDQENSYETQDRYFTELLEQNPQWESAGIYSDYGISGTNKQKRTGYKRILRHCAEGRIDRIVCKSISRFARNTSDFMTALNILHENQVTIFFEKEGLDTADPTSDFILTTLAAIAQEESRSISTNIRWGIQKRYPKGQAHNIQIYGYRYAEGEDAYEVSEDGYQIRRLEIVEAEAEVVRRIFQAVADGEAYVDIARELNKEHILAPNHGKPQKKTHGRSSMKEGMETGWTGAMISRMTTLERYCGDALLQKTYTPDYLTHESRRNEGEMPQYLVKDHHPAIISRELYDKVQKMREIQAEKYANRTGIRNFRAFSGRLVCPYCGRNYNVRNMESYPIWFCPTTALNNGKDLCHAEKVYEDQIVRMFRKAFTDRFRLLTEEVMDDVAVADILSGRYGEEDGQMAEFNTSSKDFVRQMQVRLENAQQMDFMERDCGILKRQIDASIAAVSESARRMKLLRTNQEALETRRDLLGDDTVTEEDLLSCRKRLEAEKARCDMAESEKQKLEGRLSYLEKYWEQIEFDYGEREKALEWMKELPEGQAGTVAFLNGLTSEYVKAFALSITVHDPLHYTVHWFDDTKTDVTMYSNIEDYRYTSSYYFKRRKNR